MARNAIICPHCGAIESPDSDKCHRCGEELTSDTVFRRNEQRKASAPLQDDAGTRALQGIYVLFFVVTVVYAVMLGGTPFEAFLPREAYTEAMARLGALHRQFVFEDGQWFRLFTATLLHFGIIHLFFNFMAMSAVGPETERNLGLGRFLFVYLLAGILSNVSSLFYHEMRGILIFQAGASGAICGLIGSLYVVGSLRGGMYGEMVKKVVVRWVIMILIFGYFVKSVDNAAHISGIIFGALLTWMVGLKKGVRRVQ